jgi:negative regulator of sigma E activity
MPGLTLKKMKNETETWKLELGFMTKENTRLKNRLGDILQNRFDKNLLEEIDGFKSRITKEGQIISMLKYEVADMDNLLAGEAFQDKKTREEILVKMEGLRNNMAKAENDFINMKLELNHFLSKNIL